MAGEKRVVVTGMGIVSPVGNSTDAAWASLIAGRSGISILPEHICRDYPVKVAGLVRDEQPLIDAVLSAKDQSKMDRFMKLALVAGLEAFAQAGFKQKPLSDTSDVGVYLGIGVAGLGSIEQIVHDVDAHGMRRLSPFSIPKAIANLAPSWLAIQMNLKGPVLAVTNACASSADAIGLAYRHIKHGYSKCMFAGGAESCISSLAVAGFGNMRALTQWAGDPAGASRPFEKNRGGFVLSEGAAVLVLEEFEHACARGAHMYGEIIGYGATCDAYHITAIHPEGVGAVRALQDALVQAGISSDAIDYINAHGTATAMNDAIETKIIKQVFGRHADPAVAGHVVVSSTKSMTGHLLGAAGALEACVCLLALQHGIVPPTINLDQSDPACDLDYVPHKAREIHATYAMSNSFGFGGGNASLIFKKVNK